MNKLKIVIIILLILLVSVVVNANSYSDDLKKEKDLTDKNIAKEQLKHDKKMDKYVNDYNKVSGKNIDKTKVKINKELVVDNILFTYVNIDGRDYTVLSNLQNE